MLIDYQNVAISQGDRLLIDNIEFNVREGELVYIIGGVGQGKSSFLKTIFAELPLEQVDESSAKAEVLDFDLLNFRTKYLPSLRRKMGIIFQDFQLLKDRTVEENLNFVLRATGWKQKDCIVRIEEVLKSVGMSDKSNKFPHELSGGEQQRIAIARALLNHPQLILADEPTGNLDSKTSREILQLLSSISQKGAAVIIVTHNLQLLEEFPGIVYQIENKKLHQV